MASPQLTSPPFSLEIALFHSPLTGNGQDRLHLRGGHVTHLSPMSIRSIKPLLTVTGFSLPQAVAVWGEMAAALNNTGINQGLDNLIIVLNWDSGFVSSSAQRMFTTWEWAEKSWDSPCFYPVAFKGKTKGAFWLYPMSPDFSTCQLYMYTFFKMFLNYKYCFAANISHLALY